MRPIVPVAAALLLACSGSSNPAPASSGTVAVSGIATPVAVSGVASPVQVSSVTAPLAVSGVASPVAVSGVATPVAVSEIAGPVTVAGISAPVVVAGISAPVQLSGTVRVTTADTDAAQIVTKSGVAYCTPQTTNCITDLVTGPFIVTDVQVSKQPGWGDGSLSGEEVAAVFAGPPAGPPTWNLEIRVIDDDFGPTPSDQRHILTSRGLHGGRLLVNVGEKLQIASHAGVSFLVSGFRPY